MGFSSQTSERICLKSSSLVRKDDENFNKNYQHEELKQAGGLRDSESSYRSYKKDDSNFSETEPRVKF